MPPKPPVGFGPSDGGAPLTKQLLPPSKKAEPPHERVLSMTNVVILQRVVPPYRMPLFRRLWEEFGWTVAFGKNLSADGIPVEHGAPFLRGYIFRRGPGGIIRVPVSKIIADLKPDAIIAEGALHLTSTWELVLRREFFGSPKLFFWTIGYNPSATDEPSMP